MGSIGTNKVVTSAILGPNKSHTWAWFNPNLEAVYAFNAVTIVGKDDVPFIGILEISTLKYINDSDWQHPNKRSIEFTVKNVTSKSLYYQLNMSWATPT